MVALSGSLYRCRMSRLPDYTEEETFHLSYGKNCPKNGTPRDND